MPPDSSDPTLPRCFWTAGIPEFLAYHDQEWGFPVGDDTRLFEKMSLETFQSGLSWRTILNKREAFRRAFAGFCIDTVARFDEAEVAHLLTDAGIVRHRGKIEATIANARVAGQLRERHGSLAAFVWRFEPDLATRPSRLDAETVRTLSESPASRALAAALKQAGWRFFGPTTAYAFMQAMGLINDHTEDCWCRPLVETARTHFLRPG